MNESIVDRQLDLKIRTFLFYELKGRGVEDVLFICMDGVSGLEDGQKRYLKMLSCSVVSYI